MERLDEIAGRVVERTRDRREALARKFREDDMSGVQPHEAEEGGPLLERDGEAGRSGLALLALRRKRGGVV